MMKSGWKPVIVLAILGMIGTMALPSASALVVSPSWVELNGEYGDWANTNITLTNDENKTINVTIEPSSVLSDMYISYPSVTLQPFENKTITIGAQMEDKHGYITYTWGNNQFNQFVLLTPMMGNITVQMLNDNPKPGDTVGFLLTPYVNGAGYVYVPASGNAYDFIITWGMAFVKLSAEDYGDAVAVFNGDTFHTRTVFTIEGEKPSEHLELSAPNNLDVGTSSHVTLLLDSVPVPNATVDITEPGGNNYFKITDDNGRIALNFDKKGVWQFSAEYNGMTANATVQVNAEDGGGEEETSLSIDVTATVTIGDKKWITVRADGNAVPNCPISVYMPDGGMTEYNTNTMGQLYFTFDTVGSYRFIASYHGATAQKDVTVNKKQMSIVVPDKAMVNTYVTIKTDAGATITIDGGGQHVVDTSSGEYTFKPTSKGKYTVSATTDTSSGGASFDVYEMPTIAVYDAKDNRVTDATTGQQLQVYVMGSDGVITDIDHINIRSPSGKPSTVVLTDGTGLWVPETTGTYTLTTDEKGYYSEASTSITIHGKSGGGMNNIVGVVAALILLVIVVMAYKRKIPIDKLRKFKGKKEEEEEERGEEVD